MTNATFTEAAGAKSAPRLAGEILQDVALLLKGEGELARTEMKENLREALAGLIRLAAGGAVLLAGVTAALIALAFGLVDAFGWDLWLAHLVAAVVGIVIGGLLLLWARSALDPQRLAPTRTAESLRKDAHVAQGSLR